MSFRMQFPDFPVSDMPAIPAGWIDASWRNEPCPYFVAAPSVGVYVDYSDVSKREFEEASPRFLVVRLEDDGARADEDELLATDDWQAVLDFVASYVPPAKAEAPAPVILPQEGNLDALTAELDAYCAKHGIKPRSADEMALEHRAHAEWFWDFCNRWHEEEARIELERGPTWSDDFASQPEAVARLALAFRDVLQEWIGTVGMANVRRENVALAGTGSCASHNYCDANMAMEEATRRTFGAGPLDGLDHMTDAATALWNAAWDKAKAEFLTAPKADLQAAAILARDALKAHMVETFGPDEATHRETVFWAPYAALVAALA